MSNDISFDLKNKDPGLTTQWWHRAFLVKQEYLSTGPGVHHWGRGKFTKSHPLALVSYPCAQGVQIYLFTNKYGF